MSNAHLVTALIFREETVTINFAFGLKLFTGVELTC